MTKAARSKMGRPFPGLMTLPASFFQSWLWMKHLIHTGTEPEAGEIVALLRKGEPVPDDALTLKYLAGLIEGSRGRGRPKKHPVHVERQKRQQAREDIEKVAALRTHHNSLSAAIAAFAKSRNGISTSSAMRQYQRAIKTTRDARAEWDAVVLFLIQKFKSAGVELAEEEALSRLSKAGFEPPARTNK
jgi:hypothetical protein